VNAGPVALALFAFLLGSIPFGLLIAGRRGVDIRTVGSGNIGATNVARSLGARTGAVVLVLDAAKGALPVALVRWGGLAGSLGPWAIAIAGLGAVLGHCYTPWLRFHGGKGVATALGVFVVAAPEAAAAGVAVFALVVAATRVAALGSIAATLAVTAVAWWRHPVEIVTLATILSLLIVWKHRDNLTHLRERRPR
jgi:glycerol-3-phosphate acyltransferase PlsY